MVFWNKLVKHLTARATSPSLALVMGQNKSVMEKKVIIFVHNSKNFKKIGEIFLLLFAAAYCFHLLAGLGTG